MRSCQSGSDGIIKRDVMLQLPMALAVDAYGGVHFANLCRGAEMAAGLSSVLFSYPRAIYSFS